MAAAGTDTADHVIVVGGGIIGLTTALYLRRANVPVTLIDQLPPGSVTSFGNAGLISADGSVPIALPGMLKNVPKWLTDPLGPLAVRPSYALKAAPWLMKWIAAGRMSAVEKGSDALRALHPGAFDRYRELLGPETFRDLLRTSGSVNLWDGAPGKSEEIHKMLRERSGVAHQVLTEDDLKQMFPGIAAEGKRAVLYPNNGYTVSPRRLTNAIAELVTREGGTILQERVVKIIPGESGYTVMTTVANHRAGKVVVSAGAWTKQLVKPLGVRLPLETERGYHIALAKPSVEMRLPILHRTRGYALTPMEEGLRLAGTVEIGGLDLPPDERRAKILQQNAEALFPGLKGEPIRMWMGYRPSFPDSLPAAGQVRGQRGLYINAGHGHTGMIGGPGTSRLISELITGRPPFIDPTPYRIDRFGWL